MQKIAILTLPLKATAKLAAHTFVTATGAVAATGGDAHGVVVDDAAVGDLVGVDVLGTSIVKVDADVADGGRVEVGTSGGIKPLDAGIPVGRALGAGVAGELVEVFLFQGGAA